MMVDRVSGDCVSFLTIIFIYVACIFFLLKAERDFDPIIFEYYSSDKEKRLSFNGRIISLRSVSYREIWLCGPFPWMSSLMRSIRKNKVSKNCEFMEQLSTSRQSWSDLSEHIRTAIEAMTYDRLYQYWNKINSPGLGKQKSRTKWMRTI